MFKYLRTKLTVAYGGILGAIFLVTAFFVFSVLNSNARETVTNELHAAAASFEQIWAMNEVHLHQHVEIAARDFGFRDAVASGDVLTIESSLNNLRERLSVTRAFLILPEGRTIQAGMKEASETPANVLATLEDDPYAYGILEYRGTNYQGAAYPVMAPLQIGWVIFASKIGEGELSELERLSALDLTATLQTAGVSETDADPNLLTTSIRLTGFGGSKDAELTLSYPLEKGLESYHRMMEIFGWLTLIGFTVLIVSNWFISNSLTNPISELDAATFKLASGESVEIAVRTNDEIGRLAKNFNRMADRIAEREAKINEISNIDVETGLPNRRSLAAYITDLPPAGQYCIAIRFARYTNIISTVGQTTTSRLVRKVGERVQSSDIVQAIGQTSSDTICAIIAAESDIHAHQLVSNMLNMTGESVKIGNDYIDIFLIAGIARSDSCDNLSLIDTANAACQQAMTVREDIKMFDLEMYGDPSGTLSLMSEMLVAMTDGTITLAYQPKVNLRNSMPSGVEALLRWNHPEKGPIPPDKFVQFAEETGHIRPLSEWVLGQSIEDFLCLQSFGLDVRMSVNLSGRLLTDESFTDWSLEVLGPLAKHFCMEITETAVIRDPEIALVNLNKFKAAGVEISLDDYGSGLSSLTYLKQIPANELKIDKAFIMSLAESADDALLVKSTIDLAHSLGMSVTAEGVETAEVLGALTAMGADVVQGYYICRPVPFDKAAEYLLKKIAEVQPDGHRGAGNHR